MLTDTSGRATTPYGGFEATEFRIDVEYGLWTTPQADFTMKAQDHPPPSPVLKCTNPKKKTTKECEELQVDTINTTAHLSFE